MKPFNVWTRRRFITTAAGGMVLAGSYIPSELLAEELTKTPRMTEGPFYPDKMPLDTDNDLIIINESISSGLGEVTHLHGRIVDAKGDAIPHAVMEIWQVDNNGRYIHSRDGAKGKRDGNFQGFGRTTCGADGQFYFRTIKPVTYPGRTPHIHFTVLVGKKKVLTSQFFVADAKENGRDGLLRRLEADERKRLMLDFKPVKGSKIGELSAEATVVV